MQFLSNEISCLDQLQFIIFANVWRFDKVPLYDDLVEF